MPWPWRRRQSSATRTAARHALPRQAKVWAEPAFPPAPAPVGVPVQTPSVLLGFADGSQVALDDRDPSAMALRAVADLLVQDHGL